MSSMIYSRYRHLVITGAKPAPTETQLAVIEALLGAMVLASFRDFLNVANGGHLDYVIDVPTGTGNTEEISFDHLFSADDGTFCNGTLIGEVRSARQGIKIPQGVLPFARDGGGSVVYLDLSPEGGGRVVAFVLGLPEWAGQRTESGFVVLALSFDEYVAKLRMDRELIIDCLEHDIERMSELDDMEQRLDIGMPQWREDTEFFTMFSETRRRLGSDSNRS